MIYVPTIDSNICYTYDISNGILKAHNISDYNNTDTNIDVTSIYQDRNYYSKVDNIDKSLVDTSCIDSQFLTTDIFYRYDFFSILSTLLLLCIFILLPIFYLLGRLNRHYFK